MRKKALHLIGLLWRSRCFCPVFCLLTLALLFPFRLSSADGAAGTGETSPSSSGKASAGETEGKTEGGTVSGNAAVPSPAAAGTLPGQQQSAIQKTLARLSTELQDWNRIHFNAEKIVFPGKAPAETEVLRVVYTRPFVSERLKAAEEAMVLKSDTAKERHFDHIDLVLVPRAAASFDLQAALAAGRTEGKDRNSSFYFCYGIPWSPSETEAADYTLYLGADRNFHYFGRANIALLEWIRKFLGLEGGYERLPLLADALNVEDRVLFTSRYAVDVLRGMGPEIVPLLKQSAEKAIAKDVSPVAQAAILYGMNAPEAEQELLAMLKTGNPLYEEAISSVVAAGAFQNGKKALYAELLRHRKNIEEISRFAKTAGWGKDFLPIYRKIALSPWNFREYALCTVLTAELTRKDKTRPMIQADAVEHIKLFAIRSGDVPNTEKFMKLEESDAAKEARLSKEDRLRLEPYEIALANAPETRVNIMAALSLCLFDALDPRVSKKYIVRVRNSGMNVLTRLPNDLVEKTFRMLIRNLKSEDELNRIRDVYALYRSRTITRF